MSKTNARNGTGNPTTKRFQAMSSATPVMIDKLGRALKWYDADKAQYLGDEFREDFTVGFSGEICQSKPANLVAAT